ncbi:MAG: SDR family oxidoreductase [Spirochaetales bacterium]|nr:SDR family oxidoreductase [Spirochaetales bacterium]
MRDCTNTPRSCLITGAAGVLGKAAAVGLLEMGHSVILADLHEEGMLDLKRSYGDRVHTLVMDLSRPADLEAACRRLLDQGLRVDVLVNNAGILTTNKVDATSLEEWEHIMAVNLTASFCLAKAFIPDMRERRWGRIINVSSLAAKTGGLTAGTAYSVSKGAMIALTFTLAAELASYGITVNGIAPAYIMTPMVSQQLTQEQRDTILGKIPVSRFCEPEEVAHTVTFLVDERAGFITGEIIDQNGGLHFD